MNGDTVLLRQIHPSFVQEGFPTSQAFRPTPKDESKLSVYDGDKISAVEAWRHYAQTLKLASDGVMGVTVSECVAESLKAYSDPTPYPEHAVIDFTGLNDKDCLKRGKILQNKAKQRGWLYRTS